MNSSKLGMWFFIFTEILLFAGLFLLYSVYRHSHAPGFHKAAEMLSLRLGAFNTIILLTSSLTVALSISALKINRRKISITLLVATIVLGAVFLFNKYIEWSAHFKEGIYPNSEILASLGNSHELFFGLYYVMTGLHGLHVLAGLFCFVVALIFRFDSRAIVLENMGLFWHLVDIIWIYLFPLFYLVA